MNFQITTDIHLECDGVRKPENFLRPVADPLVIAGDLYPLKYIEADRFIKFAKYLEENWGRVIWVPGNHDYWNMTYGDPMFEHVNETVGNITIAHNETVKIDDVNFVCSTMWTFIPPQYEVTVKAYLHDFRKIGNFNPYHHNKLNAKCVGYVRDTVDRLDRDREKIVVVTHHLPTWAVVSDPYRNDDATHGFANSGLDDLILDHDIVAWVHGHSHDAREDDLGGTMVVRNPLGYLGQRGGTGHDPEKVIYA